MISRGALQPTTTRIQLIWHDMVGRNSHGFIVFGEKFTNYCRVLWQDCAPLAQEAKVERGHEWISGEGRSFPLKSIAPQISFPCSQSVRGGGSTRINSCHPAAPQFWVS